MYIRKNSFISNSKVRLRNTMFKKYDYICNNIICKNMTIWEIWTWMTLYQFLTVAYVILLFKSHLEPCYCFYYKIIQGHQRWYCFVCNKISDNIRKSFCSADDTFAPRLERRNSFHTHYRNRLRENISFYNTFLIKTIYFLISFFASFFLNFLNK